MKTLIVSFVIVLFAYQTLCDDSAIKESCLRDGSIKQAEVDKAYNGNIGDARELQCYFKCYYENSGFMNDKGEIIEEKLKEKIPTGVNKSNAEKVIEKCKVHKGKDACETAYLVQKCFLNNNVKY